MSDSEKDTPNPLNDLADALSGFNLGPKWAQDKPAETDALVKKYERASEREGRGGDRKRGGDRRGGGGGGNRFGGGGGQGRREGGGGGNYGGGQRRGGGNDRRERRPERVEVPAPDYISAEIMAMEAGVDGLAKEISGTARTYSVFDMAKFVLANRDRYRVIFTSKDAAKPLFFCKKDQSVWLTRAEAVDHVKKADWLTDFYAEETVTVDPPKGNFQSVAKCGFSGEWLGPPNFHTYQTKVAELHREKFSNMSLERYKSRIVTEKGEDAINEWLESMKTQTVYRIKTAAEIAADAEAKKAAEAAETAEPSEEAPKAAEESPAAEAEAADVQADSASAEEAPAAEEAVSDEAPTEETEAPAAVEVAEEETAPAAEESKPDAAESETLSDNTAVQAHFEANYFDSVFEAQERSWVAGGIQARLLSPALLTVLKTLTGDERRYPGNLSAFLCRQFTGRHLAVFKFKGKLKCGPARPRAIPADLTLAERPTEILAWLKENNGKGLDGLWAKHLPEGSDEDLKKKWYHDLHWLINQGYVLLLDDSTLHLSK